MRLKEKPDSPWAPRKARRGTDGQIYKIIVTFVAIILLGVAGFMGIEGWSFMHSLYMAVITVSTVGYELHRPLSPVGELFITAYIIIGVGAFLYIVSQVAEYIVAGHIQGILGRKKMNKEIGKLKDHYIVCGFGRVGRQVTRELEREGADFVVIDNDEDAIAECRERGYRYVEGNASDDGVLKEAGIGNARGLVAALDSDAENVYVVLSAKNLREDVYVVARASSEEAEHKLLRAHADRVISPYSIGGRHLASMLVRPNVVEFLDVVMHSEETKLFMEEIAVRKGSPFSGLTVGEAKSRLLIGANILAMKKAGEKRVLASPRPDITIGDGDLLITMGTREQLDELEELT